MNENLDSIDLSSVGIDVATLTTNQIRELVLDFMIQVDYCKHGKISNEYVELHGDMNGLSELEKSVKSFISEHGLECALRIHEALLESCVYELNARSSEELKALLH